MSNTETKTAPTLPHTLFVETGEGDLCANQTGRPTMRVRDLSVREKEAIAARYNSHEALVDALRDLCDAFPLHMMTVKDSDHFSRMVSHSQAMKVLAQLEASGTV